MTSKFLCTLGAITLMGACGGGGGGASDGPLVIPAFPNALAVTNENNAALARVTSLPTTAAADIPRSGTAQFDGTLIINDTATGRQNASVLGGMSVIIDFANGDNVRGAAGNFFDLAGTPVDGTLAVDNVTLNSGLAAGTFEADVSGRLSNVGAFGADADYDYDLGTVGVFLGAGVQGVVAPVSGIATQVGATTNRPVRGAATLERQ